MYLTAKENNPGKLDKMKQATINTDSRIRLSVSALPLVSLCGYLSTDTGFVHPDRILDVNVLLYVEEGSFHIYEESDEYNIGPGDLLFLKQGLHHYGDIRCPKGTKWFFVHFNLSDPGNGTELEPYEQFLYTEAGKALKVPNHLLPKTFHVEKNSRIFSKFMTLEKMFASRDYSDNLNLNAYLYGILADIYEAALLEKHIDPNREKVLKMTGFLDERADRPFPSFELEEYMGLTFKHLNLLFKKATGTTLWKYHNGVRMDKAGRLLTGTELSIGEISERLGFDSPYYFCNSFKKYFGISPSEYRKTRLI